MYTAQGLLERNSAIEDYGKLVRRLAAQLIARLPSNVELDDLIQAGMIGLLDAQSRYDPVQGVKFETFATPRIKGAMLDELRGSDWIPRVIRKNQRSIGKAIQVLEQRLKRSPSEAEVANELGQSLNDYQSMLGEARGAQLVYLDELGVDSESDEHHLDRNFADQSPNPFEQLMEGQFRESLIAAIKALPDREKLVMSMYYEQELNLKEIGRVLQVTESRVCQMHTQAITRLRAKLDNEVMR
jgi:RNA polymerase sigma factor FliA